MPAEENGLHMIINLYSKLIIQLSDTWSLPYCRTDPGGLAEENGLRVGEELLEVNGVSVRDKTHEEAVTLIKQQKSLIITVRVCV